LKATEQFSYSISRQGGSERRRNSKSPANASNCSLGNFSMTRHGGGFSGLAVDVKAMLPSFAHELAALTLKMPN
jgi:hypothetical protein